MADNFHCDKCNKDFQDRDMFERHNRDQHQGMGGQQGSQQQRSDSPEYRQ